MRPPYLEADGKTVSQVWKDMYAFTVKNKSGKEVFRYVPTPKQLDFHESAVPNLLMEGTRGTGKSICMRCDAHMRALQTPGFVYLIVRRTMPELKRSHIKFISYEMDAFGGYFHKTDAIANYPNGSLGFFGHCETEEDMMKLLSSEYDAIYIDEMTTFTWPMITKIGSCLRVQAGSGKIAIMRGGTNPLGVGAGEVFKHYIAKAVPAEEEPDYDPTEYDSIHMTKDDNPFIDWDQYVKGLKRLPAHVRKAWLEGIWVVEDAYFFDYQPMKNGEPWHCIQDLPEIRSVADGEVRSIDRPFNWILFYRAIDWGFSPDPAVCLWIAILPNSRVVALKEDEWTATTAKSVAESIKSQSDGMRIVESFCDPTMFFGSEATDHNSVGDIFESVGLTLTKSKNDRTAIGYAIHEYLNTILEDGLPRLQIYEPGCPNLARTLSEMKIDKSEPKRIADGNDHWVISLGYFCLGRISTTREPIVKLIPQWMRPNPNLTRKRRRLGNESVKEHHTR